MQKKEKYLKIFANLLVAVFTIFVVFYVCPKVVVFFMPFVIGYIISLIANPMVRFLEKRLKIVRKHSSIIIIIGVLAVVILILYLAGSKLLQEAMHLIQNWPAIYHGLEADFGSIEKNVLVFVDKLPKGISQNLKNITADFSAYASKIMTAISAPTFSAAGNLAKNVPNTLIYIIMCIISSYFFTADRDKIGAYIEEHMPESIKGGVLYVIRDFKRVVGGYFKAQFKIMIVVYLILIVGLVLLDVDYVLLVALLIAILDMLPFFGTGTVLGPWAAIKLLSGDYRMAIALIVLYGVTQLVRQLIQPKIVGDSIGMNPLLALFFMFIGYKFSGVIGMIIAVPVGMIIINLYQAGVFKTQTWCLKELIKDFNEFRKI